MTRLELPQKINGQVALDLCFPCQALWFDRFESVQISPGGIVDLFKLIHEHRDDPRTSQSAVLTCPRCHDRLVSGLDVARGGRFTYHRCLQGHGRFTTFGQFMIEKGFVRQLAPAEIKTLAARVETIRCTGCGAPLDIRTQSACSHCGSPIAILDPDAVDKALADYQQKEQKSAQRDPAALAEAILAIERQRSAQKAESDSGVLLGQLFHSGIDTLFDLLT
ncbi:hypothetical protein [Propionivibrio soli]|uniref:hypothetical protein n=1 Tax=Propionivibrio soli TaxID=2976531 RepID=UPI003B845AFE